jgi:OOP family OmpA-OmpF porin
LALVTVFLFSGCACNKTWKEGFIKGALIGAAVGGGGGYLSADDANNEDKNTAIGVGIGALIGGTIGAFTNRCEEAKAIEETDSDGDGVIDQLDECPGTPRGVKVDSKGCPLDSDGDGVYDSLDKCPGTPKGVEVDSAGCPLDTDVDGVYDYKDKCPGTPTGAKVDERGCWILKGVYFDTNKWNIKPQYYRILDEVVIVLRKNPHLKVQIQGHTDNKGSAKYNQKLSENRAKSVMNYLIKAGINSERLTDRGYGLTRPAFPNTSAENTAKNRRVELEPTL